MNVLPEHRNMKILLEEDLMQATGYARRKDLMSCLRNQHIPYFLGKGGQIWTTQAALDACLVPGQVKPSGQVGLE